MQKMLQDRKMVFYLVAPGMALFLFVVLLPIVVSLYYSFTDWDGWAPTYNFIGFSNFKNIFFHDHIFWPSILNAVWLVLAFLLIQHPIGVLTAIFVTKAGKWESTFRTIIFIPAIISSFITSQLWVSVFSTTTGLLNHALEILGLESWKHDWLGDPNTAIICIILVIVWHGFGYCFLIYYTGVKGISSELYEAAELDGANNKQMIRYIILPLLVPVIKINMLLAIIAGFKQMETVLIMTNGGPGGSTHFIGTYLYGKGFAESMFGYSNALSVIFVIVCLLATGLFSALFRKENEL